MKGIVTNPDNPEIPARDTLDSSDTPRLSVITDANASPGDVIRLLGLVDDDSD